MLLVVGINVGFRIAELLSWRMDQVLTSEGDIVRELTVTRALLKGGGGIHKGRIRSRRVVLNERARGAIRDYLASLSYVPRPDDFLFKSREGGNRPIDRGQARRILKGLCRACGIDDKRVATHSLRKSFVRAVYDASKRDLVLTQRILGHSSPIITARYLDSTESEQDNVVLALSSHPEGRMAFGAGACAS
jgi:integrase